MFFRLLLVYKQRLISKQAEVELPVYRYFLAKNVIATLLDHCNKLGFEFSISVFDYYRDDLFTIVNIDLLCHV